MWKPKKLSSEVGPPQLMESKVIDKLTRFTLKVIVCSFENECPKSAAKKTGALKYILQNECKGKGSLYNRYILVYT